MVFVVGITVGDPLRVVALAGGLLLGVLFVAGLAVSARRLLGLNVGVVRTMVAGGAGYTVAAFVSQAIKPLGPHRTTLAPPLELLPVLIGIAVLVAMGFLALAEAVVPSGSRLRPLRALRRRWERTRRYSQISSIAVRHGLGPYLRGRRRADANAPQGRARLARSLRLALEEGGVTFVKLGQLLSTRPDLLAAEFVSELKSLQHQVAPAPWPEVEQLLVEELGGPVSSEFVKFDPEPLAAASIGRCTRLDCVRAQTWWSRSNGPGFGRSSSVISTSCCPWPARSTRGRDRAPTRSGRFGRQTDAVATC